MPKVPSYDKSRPGSRSAPRERSQGTGQSQARRLTTRRERQDPAGQNGRRGRSGSRSRRRVSADAANDARAMPKDAPQASQKEQADVPKTPLASSEPSARRKFMVEIGSDGEVVQVFEFSDDGAPTNGKTPKFVEVR